MILLMLTFTLSKFIFNFSNDAWFMDLYVRVSNKVAISMYKRLGYRVYRTIDKYYEGRPDEDAFGIILNNLFQYLFMNWLFNKIIFSDMRKILPRSTEKKFKIPMDLPILDDLD